MRRSHQPDRIGMSSGVFYAPGQAADLEELQFLARTVGKAGGVYTAHIRDERDAIVEALQEAFAVAQPGRTSLVLSHHKCAAWSDPTVCRMTRCRIHACGALSHCGVSYRRSFTPASSGDGLCKTSSIRRRAGEDSCGGALRAAEGKDYRRRVVASCGRASKMPTWSSATRYGDPPL